MVTHGSASFLAKSEAYGAYTDGDYKQSLCHASPLLSLSFYRVYIKGLYKVSVEVGKVFWRNSRENIRKYN